MEKRAPKYVQPCSTDLRGLQDAPYTLQAHLRLKTSSAWTPAVSSVFSGRSSPLCTGGSEDEDALSSDGLVKDQV